MSPTGKAAFLGERIFCGEFVNVTDEVIMEYIRNQDADEKDDNFKINEGA